MSRKLDHFTMTMRGAGGVAMLTMKMGRAGGVAMSSRGIAVEGRSIIERVPLLHGKGLRIYIRSGDDELTALAWMHRLEDLAEILTRRPAGSRVADLLVELADSGSRGGRRRSRRFASIELKTRTVTRLDDISPAGFDTVLQRWLAEASFDELLLEINASSDCLAGLLRECVGSVSDPDDPPATKPGDVRGDELRARLPFETPESATLRAELSRDWVDSEGVSRLLGSAAGNMSHLPSRLRREGKILGVWVLPEHRYRFPPWQFRHGRPIQELGPLLTLLRSANGVARGRRTSGWEEIEWLCRPHARLEGRRPCDMLAADPRRVLEVATAEFTEDPDARW